MDNHSDVLVIGGGINGVAIAADAAGRGLKVTLCEKGDLGSGTSSASSQLIHGGLRYLEFYEFGLVKKALHEREVLLFRAPFLVHPLEFRLPHESHLRPAWMIRLGLYLYDHLSRRITLPKSKAIDLSGLGLLPHLTKGFSYYDCITNDARLVILNALSAKEKGATLLTRTEFISAIWEKDRWHIILKNPQGILSYTAKVLINAAGPWVKSVQEKIAGISPSFDVLLDKGSHIVTAKLYEGSFAYILQNKDNRIIFVIPYLDRYSLIGTTDISFKGDLDAPMIDPDEKKYLCDVVNDYFQKKINENDIIHAYSGVRCLKYQPKHTNAAATRDFQCLVNNHQLTVIGGKLTTHRVLAEQVVNELKYFFKPLQPAWTATSRLPGGNIANFSEFLLELNKNFPNLPSELLSRYAKSYGTNCYVILENVHSIQDLGTDYLHGLYQKEIDYLVRYEWATTTDDILWRRTKLGMIFSDDDVKKLHDSLVASTNGYININL